MLFYFESDSFEICGLVCGEDSIEDDECQWNNVKCKFDFSFMKFATNLQMIKT